MGVPATQMRRSRGAQGQNTQSVGYPAPTAGLIANNPLYSDITDANAAIWLYNMIPRELGCTVRPGSKEIATNIPDVTTNPGEVRTIMAMNSVVAGGGGDFLFAVTNAGIFDITAGGAGPWVADLVWPTPGGDAGWCAYVNFTNVAGDHFLLVTDEVNGYYVFDGLAWAQGTITSVPPGLDAADLVHITEWAGRLWFTEKNTARAWYLDVLDLAGDATPLDVGSRFTHGGHLVQCATWTVDDGVGLNDRLVMASSAGDLLVWDGDPDVTTDPLTLLGRWYVGAMVEGRRAVTDWGGETVVLSSDGVTPLAELLTGQFNRASGESLTNKIARYFRAEMKDKRDFFGWEVAFNALESIVIISVPNPTVGIAPIQFAVNVNTNTWCFFRDLDILTMRDSVDGFYFGTRDGRVMIMEGTADDVSLDGLSAGTIEFSLLTHYSDMGTPGIWKRPQFIRPSWIGSSQPIYDIEMRYDFDLTELQISPPYVDSDIATWDNAIWGRDKWAGSAQQYFETVGVNGMGRHVGIALRGQTTLDLGLVGFDLLGDLGGML